jgi:hypothetical protein
VVGSALFVAVAWCVRVFRARVLRIDPHRPERWRLAVAEGVPAAR